MQDWRDEQVRYLIHFDGGGSGMRFRDAALAVGDVLTDAGERYRSCGSSSRATRGRSGTRGRSCWAGSLVRCRWRQDSGTAPGQHRMRNMRVPMLLAPRIQAVLARLRGPAYPQRESNPRYRRERPAA